MFKVINQIFQRSSIVLINQLSLLITIPYIASIFSSNTFGLFSQSIIFIQVTWVISEWGINNYCINIFPKDTKNQNHLFIEISSMVFILLITISFFIFLIIKILNINIDLYLYLLLVLSFIFGGLNPLWFFQAQLRPKVLIFPTLITRIIFLILIFVFVKSDSDIYFYFFVNSFVFIGIFIFSIWILKKEGLHFFFTSFHKIKSHLGSSFYFFLSSVIGNQFSTFWMFTFSIKSSPSLIAIYAIADHFLRAMNTLTNIISNVIWANSSKISQINTYLLKYSFLIFLLAFIAWIFISPLIDFLFNDFYLASIKFCQALIVIWLIHGLTKIYLYPVFAKFYSLGWVNKINILFGFFHILTMILWLIFSEDIWVMIYSMMIISSIQLIFYFSYRYFKNFKSE